MIAAVDSKTRVMDIGATGVFSNVERDLGHPVAIILDNVARATIRPPIVHAIFWNQSGG